ncbi:alpha/beta hydrolase [Lignipirellula cremea]|uniref:Carboxylesterase NlhH n=1 Tax=Lignipirellula cremea TaxID=2528010 RepID=A0A518DW02_9BACT|nr:alpha/beta hydrolase [Lignipirellula cremea]QDU96022.1 Carboxylesterase NlhH [Lignipirellula cremea]
MKPTIRLVLTLAILTLSAPLTAAEPTGIYQRGSGFTPDKVVTFKRINDRSLKLDLFLPADWKASDTRPAAVFFFGGGWSKGDTRHFYAQAKYLASRGMVAICPDYRIKKIDGVQPYDCVEDAKSALRYVRKHASELGIDPERIAAGGGSAGGHLAAAAATVKAYDCPDDDLSVSPVPNALLLYNPACDISPEGAGFDRMKDYWKTISPMENLIGKVPPTLILLGEKDVVFPPKRARIYQQRMQAGDNRCELVIYPGESHGFFNLDRGSQPSDMAKNKKIFLATTAEMDRFLQSLGYVSGEPSVGAWFNQQEARDAAAQTE